MSYEPLKYIYQPSGNPEAATMLLLHGTGGDERDLLPLAKNYGTHFNILSLRGNVSENGMPRFFKRLGMGIFDEKDLDFRTHEMVSFIRQLAEKENFDPSKIIALGYSNGANIAGSTLVLYPDFLAGAILFRPMKPFKAISDWQTGTKAPVFMSTGKSDPTIRPEDTLEWVSLLEKAGFDLTHFELNSGHNLTNQDLQLSVDWFKKYFV
jgi:phospholipase/carboxylesterase